MPPLQRSLRPLGVLAVLALLGAGCGSSVLRSRHRASPLISIFEAPVQLASSPGPTLDLLRRLGVADVRVIVRWSDVAPAPTARAAPARFNASSPAAYPASGWAPYDAIVRDAAARRVGVLLNVSGPAPLWASGRRAPPGGVPGVWKPSAAKFRLFVRAVGLRYSGHYTPAGASSPLPRVSFWSIWNEPNLGQADLAPQAVKGSTVESSAQMYRTLLAGGWSSLQATGHGHDTILIGELAPYGQTFGNSPGNFGEMVPMRFVRALYCVDASLRPLRGTTAAARGCPTTVAASRNFAARNPALFAASGFAVHPYPSGAVPPSLVVPGSPDFVYLATLPRLERFLDSVTHLYGSAKRFLFYSTEYGYKSNPPFPGGAPLPLAAEYINWAEYIAWRTPRLRSWDQYLLVDPPSGGPSEFVTGLEFDTGKPKPSYAAYRMPFFLPSTREQHGRGLEVWGGVRPARYTSLPQQVHIELRPRGQDAFKSVATVPITDADGYFDTIVHFPSAGLVRLAWSYPDGEAIYSRQVAITTG